MLTNEWNDGLVSYQVKEIVNNGSKFMNWLIFDGPADS